MHWVQFIILARRITLELEHNKSLKLNIVENMNYLF